jgi:shikimate kinase
MIAAPALDMPLSKQNTGLDPAPVTLPRTIERVVLTGFMGSGKTTAGRLLAARLGWKFIDLDHEIERRNGRSIPAIFATEGEAHFRHLETAALASLLGQSRVVLALGGGAPEVLGNRLLLEQTPRTSVVYLSAPLEHLLHRCRLQAEDPTATARPVLANLDHATLRYSLRRPLYERIASHRIDTSILSIENTVEAILKSLTARP